MDRTEIDDTISAIENFVLLSRSSRRYRRIVPLASLEQPFVSFSERELGILFWQKAKLQKKLQELALEDFQDKDIIPRQSDMESWLQKKAPGTLITEMLSDIGKPRPRKGRGGFRDSTSVMDLDKMRSHLQSIQKANFDPRIYNERGYAHRGSIRTDGFRLQLLAFKLKELQSVRYKRLPAEVLPPRITSTVGGCDFYLTEVRNIVKTPQDVVNLWGCSPDAVKILGLDLGQACVVGASAILPKKPRRKKTRSKKTRSKKPLPKNDKVPASEKDCTDIEMKKPFNPRTKTKKVESDVQTPPIFRNLAVKQKAVYQPTFKHRRWMEEEKNKDPGQGLSSISAVETRLPPQHGAEASLASYLTELGAVKEQLHGFYNGNNRFKKHKWDARRAKEEEYGVITDRLLNMVGGSIGAKKHKDNKVVIGIGLGKFSTKARLTSLHESFQSYFVQKVNAVSLHS